MIKTVPTLLLVALLCALMLPAQTPSFDQRLDKIFFEWDRQDRPGCAVVVVQEGKVILTRTFGRAVMAHNIPITAKTIFDVQAIAMPFTATAIHILVQEGKLSLTDDIRKYLPQLPDYGKVITVANLLNHSSGLWDWEKALSVAGWRMADVVTHQDVMTLLTRQETLLFEPGTKHQVSASNYVLLAQIVKQVGGQEFRDWTWKNLFRPLKMRDSLFRDRYGEPVENQTFAYVYDRMKGYVRESGNLGIVGSHGLYSSIQDLGKWLVHLQMAKGTQKAVMDKLLSPGTLTGGGKINFAGGFQISEAGGFKTYSVYGNRAGYSANLQYIPKYKLAVVLLSNWESRWATTRYTVMQLMQLYQESLLTKTATATTGKKEKKADAEKEEKKAAPVTVTVDPTIYDRYTGTYSDGLGNRFKIGSVGDKLYYHLNSTRKFHLLPISETEYMFSFGNTRFRFYMDASGTVDRLTVQGGNRPLSTWTKLKRPQLTASQLKEYTGTYYCKQLECIYSVTVKQKNLVLSHLRLQDVPVLPAAQDRFETDTTDPESFQFIRDKQKKISGFKMDALKLLFKKIDF